MTADNFFVSIDLAVKLLEKDLFLIGTLKKNKPYIPKEFLPHRVKFILKDIKFEVDDKKVFYFSREKLIRVYLASMVE